MQPQPMPAGPSAKAGYLLAKVANLSTKAGWVLFFYLFIYYLKNK